MNSPKERENNHCLSRRCVNCLKILYRSKFRLFLLLAVVVLFSATHQYLQFFSRNDAVENGVADQLEKKGGSWTSKYDDDNLDSSRKLKFVVDTSACRIPEMNPMDASIRGFLKPDWWFPTTCKRNRAWTFMSGTVLNINVSAVHYSGYSINSIHCCYKTIERVEQPLSDYDLNADNYIRYSDKCHPVRNGSVEIDAEFIRVHCISKSIPFLNDVVYREFFAIPQENNDRLVYRKLKSWKRKSMRGAAFTPPNVVIIGIDNNSRMNSHRNLHETIKVLRKLGAVELMGYTKVAENTYSNSIPILTGHNTTNVSAVCHYEMSGPQDYCPFIWRAYDQLGYITVNAEDTPYLGSFNYLKTGFLRKPTDFYLRPLFLAVMTHLPRYNYYHTDCIGSYTTEEIILNYLLETIKMTNSYHAPAFIFSWLTSIAHHNYNNLKFADGTIANFLTNLVNSTNDNTIFFFVSDHGQRYGPIRETSQGWYEDKLPSHWVYLPDKLRKKYTEWQKGLEGNVNRLTSHYDFYKTMLHILKTWDVEGKVNASFYKKSKNQKGQSLFEQVLENRTCEDAGITVNYCPCSKPEPIDVNSEDVLKAAEVAVRYLTSQIPLDVCAQPTLKRIVSAGYLKSSRRPVYVISLYTDPGDFFFEANVEKELPTGNFVISTDLLRMNKISRSATCVNTSLLERYCYCK